MKKFRFELEDVLQFRKFERQQAEIELGKALAVEREIQDKLDNLAAQQVEVAEKSKGSKDFQDIANAYRFYDFVRAQTEYLMNEMSKAKIVSDEKREILRAAKMNSLRNTAMRKFLRRIILLTILLRRALESKYRFICLQNARFYKHLIIEL